MILHDYKHRAMRTSKDEFAQGALTATFLLLMALALFVLATPAHADPFMEFGLTTHSQVKAAPIGSYWRYDINRTRNPYGVVVFGYRYDLSEKLELSLSGRHESSLIAGDHGVDSLQVILRVKL